VALSFWLPLRNPAGLLALVEQSTLAYLPTVDDDELNRIVTVHDRPGKRYTVDGLLWNLIIHEARHVAQISVLLRPRASRRLFLTC